MNLKPLLTSFALAVALVVPTFAAGQAPATPAGRPARPPAPSFPAEIVKTGAPLPAGVTRVTTVEGITEYRLANGLKVLLFPDASKPTITVNITYLVGSRHENYGETGMAHLLEHLMFKGSKKHTAIDQEFNQRGVRFNGTTWLDRTNYFELFQASDDNLAWAIELESDRMVNSFIAKKDLDSEMTVVRNEYEQGENSPVSVLVKRMQSVAYDWHSYGRSTIGNRSDIEHVKIENLQAFYRLYYQPDNAVLLIAGKFDEAKALALVAKHFGAIPKPTRTLPPLWTVEPTQDGTRDFTVRRKGDIQIVMIAYKVPSNLHIDSDAIGFAGFILGQAPTGRLHKAIVESGKASQVFSYPLLGVDPGIQIFGAIVKRGDPVEPVRDEIQKIVESFGASPPTEQEMARSKQTFLNQSEKTLANHEAIGVQMSEYIALGDWRLFFLARDDIAKMKSEDVAAASNKYFRRDNRTTGMFLPEDDPQRAEIPSAPTVAEVMKDFTPKAATLVGEAFDPSQANIDARTKRFNIGEMKVALLSKKNRGETVNVSLALHIGNEKALFGQQTAGALAAQMMPRGTTRFTRAQLSDEFERLKVSGRVAGPGASIQTTRPNLEAALRLVAHVLKEPTFPQNEFEQLVNQSVTSLMANLSEPGARAGEEISKHFNIYPKGDWRYTPTLEESLAQVKAAKLEDVKRFYQQFYGASPAEIAIVGDFDEAAVTALLKDLFAGWKPAVPFERVTMQFRDIPPMEKSVATPDKENAVFLARQNVNIRDDDPDYAALYLADYILGGGAGFESRFMTRIRQKEGLSYSVGSDLSVGSLDRAGVWSAYAIAAPANIAKVEIAFKEELARALKDGFTDAELASAKSGILQKRTQSRAQDGTVAGAWVAYLFLGRTFAWSKQFEDKLMALKPADVVAALRKYIDPAKVTVVKAGDFSKK
jgi:zinc protease